MPFADTCVTEVPSIVLVTAPCVGVLVLLPPLPKRPLPSRPHERAGPEAAEGAVQTALEVAHAPEELQRMLTVPVLGAVLSVMLREASPKVPLAPEEAEQLLPLWLQLMVAPAGHVAGGGGGVTHVVEVRAPHDPFMQAALAEPVAGPVLSFALRELPEGTLTNVALHELPLADQLKD